MRAVLSLLLAGCALPETYPGSDERVPETVQRTPGVLDVVVTDAEGAPLEGATVVVDPHGFEGTTDAEGHVQLSALEPNSYAVWIAHADRATSIREGVEIAADEVTQLDVQLDASDEDGVRLTVTGPDGAPLLGAIAQDSSGGQGSTDASGEVVLTGLGGLTVDIEIIDAEGRLWSRTVTGLEVPESGGAQVAVALSGRPAEDAVTVGSAACLLCHTEEGEHWLSSSHAAALSEPLSGASAAAFLTGESVALGAATAWLSAESGEPVVVLESASAERRSYTVAGLIGSSSGGGIPWVELDDGAWPLPLAWVPVDETWPDWPDGEARIEAWNTAVWLDEAGEFTFSSGGAPASSAAAESACFGCHATGFSLSIDAGTVDMQASNLSSGRWEDASVGCERCHGPGSSHLEAEEADRAWWITQPSRLDTDRANEVCAQCHGGLEGDAGLPLPWTESGGFFEPGEILAGFASPSTVDWPSGAAAEPGQQADELARSRHGAEGEWAMRCTDCHAPHGSEFEASLRRSAQDNSLCSGCHLGLDHGGDQAALEAHDPHSSYEPAGESRVGRCTTCHMPATSARLAFGVHGAAGDRSSHLFRISAPAETIAVFDDAGVSELPVGDFPAHACQQCHLYGAWSDAGFSGAAGDPTLRESHSQHQDAYEDMFP